MQLGLGYLPDPEDRRDLKLNDAPLALAADQAPDFFDALVPHVRGLLYQDGSQGCTGFSAAQAFRTRSSYLGRGAILPSALLLWYMGRKTHGEENRNSGTYLRAVLKEAHALGLVPELKWPSDDAAFDFMKDPARDPRVLRCAYDARGFGYYRCAGLAMYRKAEFKRALASGCPVIFGTDVSFDFTRLKNHDPIPPPIDKDIAGGHAMCAVAYDERGIIGPQTWGPDWGNDGWFHLSWEYVMWGQTRDCWAISDPKVMS